MSNETVGAINTENDEPPTIFDDGAIKKDVQSRVHNTAAHNQNEVNQINTNHNHSNNNSNEVMMVSSTTDLNNVIDQSFGARNNVTNARDAIVTVARSSSMRSISNAPINFTKDFSHDESVDNR